MTDELNQPDELRTSEICCESALHIAHAFLRGDLPEVSASEVRQHLLACEDCMDEFDVEMMLTQLLRRCSPRPAAPANLRARIVQMHVTWER